MNTMKITENGCDMQWEPTITISLARYQELIRKEIGYDYRKEELQNAPWLTPSTADKIIFQVKETPKGCEAPAKDDDF